MGTGFLWLWIGPNSLLFNAAKKGNYKFDRSRESVNHLVITFPRMNTDLVNDGNITTTHQFPK
jgi:hypothetical protein